MNDDIQPASIPDKILDNAKAIDLYLIAVWALALMGGFAIVGAVVLSFFDKAVPGEVWTVVGIAVGALSVMLGGERK